MPDGIREAGERRYNVQVSQNVVLGFAAGVGTCPDAGARGDGIVARRKVGH